MPPPRSHDPCAVLPDLALELIASRLTVADLARASCVSTAFRTTFEPECHARKKALRSEFNRALFSAVIRPRASLMPSRCIPGIYWKTEPACGGQRPGTHHRMYEGPRLRLVPPAADDKDFFMSSYMDGLVTIGPIRVMKWNDGPVADLVPGFFRGCAPAPDEDAAAAFLYLSWYSVYSWYSWNFEPT